MDDNKLVGEEKDDGANRQTDKQMVANAGPNKSKLLTQEEMTKFLSDRIFSMQNSIHQHTGPVRLAKIDTPKQDASDRKEEQGCKII
uniref:Ovule protein n=1 Tax=Rhabditophanes sp. KR3021 TaxID=114890 RepID=A0AC35TI90_9BILA